MWDKDIVECMIRSRGLVWHLAKSFEKGERLNQKLKMKICKMGDVCKQTSLLKCITDGNLGPKPQLLGNFFAIFWKKSYFNAFGSHFACVQNHLKELDFESQLKK